jgi:hypothetical protein
LTIGLNVSHVLNDYGVKNNKLHVEVLAQSNQSGGGTTGGGSGGGSSGGSDKLEGPKLESLQKCEISGTLIRSVTSSTNSALQWGFNGSIKMNGIAKSFADIAADGGFDKKDAEGKDLFDSGTVKITVSFTSKMTMCQKTSTEKCAPFDPCIEKLKEYRSFLQ